MRCRVDSGWHHISVSWIQATGQTTLMFDGNPIKPYMSINGRTWDIKKPSDGGAHPRIGAGTLRKSVGEHRSLAAS